MSDCGVFAAYLFPGHESMMPSYLEEGAKGVQHRGFEAVGESTFTDGKIHTRRGFGLARELFAKIREDDEKLGGDIRLRELCGQLGIVHTRYSTCGDNNFVNIQPYSAESRTGIAYSVIGNENVANYEQLKIKYSPHHTFTTTNDIEIFASILGDPLGELSLEERATTAAKEIIGSYCAVQIVADSLRLEYFRDGHGFFPFWFGQNDDGYFLASEDIAFKDVGVTPVREINPGEAGIINENGIQPKIQIKSSKSHCWFQYVYHMRPESTMEKVEVGAARMRLGRKLAREVWEYTNGKFDVDVVIAIPNSGNPYASGFVQELDAIRRGVDPEAKPVFFQIGFYKDPFSGRSFLLPPKLRSSTARRKLSAIGSSFEGKRVFLAEDSLVRGTSIEVYANEARKKGATWVGVGTGAPPIIEQCQYGIDYYRDELLARKMPSIKSSNGELAYDHREMCEFVRRETGVDLFVYNRVQSLFDGIGLPEDYMCKACITGKYQNGHPIFERTRETVKV